MRRKMDMTVAALTAGLILGASLAALAAKRPEPEKVAYPPTPKVPADYTVSGVAITDDYQWLENGKDPKVVEWTAAEEALTASLLKQLPIRPWLAERFNALWRYDDQSTPRRVLVGDRLFFSTKRAADEHWVYCTRENKDAPAVELLNPNQWGAHDTLDFTVPSFDGKVVAYGRASGGDENPITHVMEVATKRELPDTLKGWRQEVTAWLPDGSGFYYSAKPKKGDVPGGEEFYWHSAYFHKLGTQADQDRKVLWDDKNKELWHQVDVSEDGQYEFYYKSLFDKNEVYFRRAGSQDPLVPIATGFDGIYGVTEIGGRLFVQTDWQAPMGRVMVTTVDKPGRENWQVFLPETKDNLSAFQGVNGLFYATYLHDAYTLVKIYGSGGVFVREMTLPTLGTASISGHWSQPEVWVRFASFAYPPADFLYDAADNELRLYHRTPVPVDVSNVTAEQIWFNSKDGTRVPLFLVHRKDMKRDGKTPTILTGYGGFNISEVPRFSTLYAVITEAGGAVAIANLRGGGEFGQAWHHGGWRDKKQKVFDDFIAAAECLVSKRITSKERLGIEGGSNGGLLMGAALTQRPDLFKAVLCEVPLLDMVRFHKFGVANVWTEEYGSPDDPAAFKWLYAYSPYHRVKDGTRYPAVLLVGSDNDARVDPMHARKMAARLQEADKGGGPILLYIQKASGHGGGTTIATQVEQYADTVGFLMDQIGLRPPSEKPAAKGK